jgi:hypothetical protein
MVVIKMGLLNIFSHNYDIRAKVLLSDGRMVNVEIPVKARKGIGKEELKETVVKETEKNMRCKVKKVIKMYDANENGDLK